MNCNCKPVSYGVPWSDIQISLSLFRHMKFFFSWRAIWSYSINILILAESDSLETSKSASAVHWEQYRFFSFSVKPKAMDRIWRTNISMYNTLHTRTYSCRTSFYIIMLTWLVSCSELPLRITLKLKNINVLTNLKSRQLDEISDLNSHRPTVSEITS